ncbi:flagellar basal-body MS-ring/collar protein FliF [Zhenpiania hominis]|uniref:Flagellar M-ring protein FliF n=1 Tax=Zhenpiania hominis TaxID=2763644 RepID=A0A923NJP3_9FIRM|nr:flagellar basal-body MS-ring/collar protein FliF [Zhenpiania hominis]MBC6678304.1 flagellar M-ring protein FliF [Zhenpiania hominis]
MNLDNIKAKLNGIGGGKFGEFLGKLSKKTKILIAVIAVIVIAGAIITAVILNHKEYVVLFSDVSEEEATQIVGHLQDSGVDYQYEGDGTIMVEESVADQTRADLVYEGYPKSGFTYDIFTQNAGGMTTDTEKQTYKLYELQDRIGATIGLFDGVKDAKVTIALEEEQRYALESEEDKKSKDASASVVVTMEDGGSPTEEQAAAIQRLVAKSVPDMALENVAVFDGNGIEVSVEDGEGTKTSGDTGEEIAQIIENQITKKVANVLGPIYGAENIRVSAKGTVNMERVLRESTTYETPEKINERDKTGIISNETTSREESNGGTGTGGVAGSETNADVSEYTTITNGGDGSYTSETATRDYLVNQIKEQGELDPGSLEDLSVAVTINGTTLGSLTEAEARSLIANATGIAQADQDEKITIVAAPFYTEGQINREQNAASFIEDNLLYIAIAAALLLAIAVALLLIVRRRRRKAEEDLLDEEDLVPVMPEEEPVENPELLNLKGEKTRELRETVREFSEQNPEISAQMIRTWLNGGGDSDGGKSNA